MTRVLLVGFGEVGQALHDDLAAHGVTELAAWDIAFTDPGSRASRNQRSTGVSAARAAAEAARDADLVISAVTPANTLAAAGTVAAGLPRGCYWLDVNSASPAQKRAAATAVENGGGRFVEAALMSPIAPRGLGSPFLLGGPHAREFALHGSRLGLANLTVYSDAVGVAAAAKLCRSVIVKGMESLFAEALVPARAYGVERDVLASLPTVLPEADWSQVAHYFLTRTVEHGARRAEELAEAASTVADAGLDPWLADATARRQAWAAQHPRAVEAESLGVMLDRLGAPAPVPPESADSRGESP